MAIEIKHPHIVKMISLYEGETQPFRKVHRLVDLLESLIKTHTAIILSNYFAANNISDKIKVILAEGLRVPSLGIWHLFNRELIAEIGLSEFSFSTKNICQQYSEFAVAKFSKDFTNIDKIINFRNSLAHGATPSDENCSVIIAEIEPLLRKFLGLPVFVNTTIIAVDVSGKPIEIEGNPVSIDLSKSSSDVFIPFQPYLVAVGMLPIGLGPIVTLKQLPNHNRSFFGLVFFNDLKKFDKKKISLLHYPEALRFLDQDIYNDFIEKIPISQWKSNNKNDVFKQRIDELTEVFKGRIEERKLIHEFTTQSEKGFLFIYGNPGIGKSALLAQVAKELKSNRSETSPVVFEYFIRRNTVFSSPEKLLDYFNENIELNYSTKFPSGTGFAEKKTFFIERLRKLSSSSMKRRLIILIDGLDEAIDEEKNILKCLTAEIFNNVLFILGSRKLSVVEQFYGSIAAENKKQIEIGGLSAGDIRAMLYDITDKYAIEDQFVRKILERSEGNPLYVRLLCNSMEEGEISLNESSKLPSTLNDFYSDFMRRISARSDGNMLLKALYVFAGAKDFLTYKQLELILDVGEADAQKIIYELREFLFENPITEFEDYQLFHESFRGYLKLEKKTSVREAELRLIHHCRKWNDILIIDSIPSQYIFKYYSTHLLELELKEELFALVFDERFLMEQLRITRNKGFSFAMIEQAIILNSEEDLELSLRLFIQGIKLHKLSSLDKKTLNSALSANEEDFNLLLDSRGSDGIMELAIIILGVCVNDLLIAKNSNFERLRIADQFLNENESLILEIQSAVLKISPLALCSKIYESVEGNNSLILISKIFEVKSEADIVVEKEYNENEQIKLNLKLIIDIYSGDKEKYFKNKFNLFQDIKGSKLRFEKIQFSFFARAYLLLLVGISYLIQPFIYGLIYSIQYFFDKHFRARTVDEQRGRLIRLQPFVIIGRITSMVFYDVKEQVSKFNCMVCAQNLDSKAFESALKSVKSQINKADCLILFAAVVFEIDKKLAFECINKALQFLDGHFTSISKSELSFVKMYLTRYDGVLSKESKLGEFGEILINHNVELFKYYYSSIIAELQSAEMENSKPLIFNHFFNGFIKTGYWNRMIDLLGDYCLNNKFKNAFYCYLVYNEDWIFIMNNDNDFQNQKQSAWSEIRDFEWKKCTYGEVNNYVTKKDYYGWISYELKEKYEFRVVIDFMIENREVLKYSEGDLDFLLTDDVIEIESHTDEEKMAKAVASNKIPDEDLICGENHDFVVDEAYRISAEKMKTSIYNANKMWDFANSYFGRRDCFYKIKPEMFWEYIEKSNESDRKVYLYFFQKFLVGHNVLEEYLPKLLPLILRDRQAMLKMAYRLAIFAWAKNNNGIYGKMNFNEKLGELVDISVITGIKKSAF